MKRSNGVRVVGILAIIIVLPLLSLLVVRQGAEVRANAKPSTLLLPDSTHHLPAYQLISQRGDTITRERMLGKVCVYQFISDSTTAIDTAIGHALFELQQDYYGITLTLRILSVTLTPETDDSHKLEYLSEIFSCREMWHVLRSDTGDGNKLFAQCGQISPLRGNLSPKRYVYITDRRGNIRGYYNPLDKYEFNALFQDVLYLINN